MTMCVCVCLCSVRSQKSYIILGKYRNNVKPLTSLFLLSMYNKTSIFGKIELKDEIFSKYLHIIKGMFVSMIVLIAIFSGINYNFEESSGKALFLNLLLIAMHIIGLIITSYSYQVLIKKNYNEKNKLK